MFFQSRDSYTVQKFLSPFAFENFIFISRSLKFYYHLLSVNGLNSHLNHTLTIQDEKILVTFKFRFTKLKRIDTQ